jgi:O-acetyl-ADP-ribose deacetylase (regulator of RNase III)
MITYKRGDVTNASEQLIVHGCNAQGVMGSGVALAIRRKWPWVYDAYAQLQPPIRLGHVQFIETKPNSSQYVGNAITQEYYGKSGTRFVSYDAIDECMQRVHLFLYDNELIDSVAMPKIGAGLGGGDWGVIEAIIKDRLADHNVSIYEL